MRCKAKDSMCEAAPAAPSGRTERNSPPGTEAYDSTGPEREAPSAAGAGGDRKSTRPNPSHLVNSEAVFRLKKQNFDHTLSSSQDCVSKFLLVLFREGPFSLREF